MSDFYEGDNYCGATLLRVYAVDDEHLALKRLEKLLAAFPSVEIAGGTTDPAAALKFLESEEIDVLFLDIQMPGMNGFELLANLRRQRQPLVIFTTAYDRYALKAFEVNSIDYLLKPVEPEHLNRALKKVARLRETAKTLESQAHLQKLAEKLAENFRQNQNQPPERISTRVGSRILFIDLDRITHFYAADKLTFAATDEVKKYVVDYTIAELEEKFAGKNFVRVHRSALVNLSYVDELYRWFAGGMRIRIKDKKRTELTVSRDRAANLKQRLGLPMR